MVLLLRRAAPTLIHSGDDAEFGARIELCQLENVEQRQPFP